MDDLQENLFALLREKGAKLIGVADMEGYTENGLNRGVAVAIPVPAHIVEEIKTNPTIEYYQMYHTLNAQLDEMVEAGAAFLQKYGFRARANTKKNLSVNDDLRTPYPYKTVATKAGLGWIGKSCLLVTEEYGSAVRLSSLLTDAPLEPAIPITESRCGNCRRCVDACPGQAIIGTAWTAGMPREDIIHAHVCKETQITRMREFLGFYEGERVCGRCFAVCTYTQKYLRRTLSSKAHS
ncbi:4Fe-4S double cluster binding domain-containing protein [Selenomonas ruminis]|uniref:Epoxyqueuosine reductase n=1 Tax=Selenomonas ruminis TaxID=2593411 RepID=A0A5D6VY53_9FIRM|nr:4Fe-4S double cluster binding domain-containing protein [Selenomonas sp. mPRGC5]TYZ20212.1 epoxyqueuosine reductase [Selenomonas sp. mPRGC5]